MEHVSYVEVCNGGGVREALVQGRKTIGDYGIDVNVGISDGFENFITS